VKRKAQNERHADSVAEIYRITAGEANMNELRTPQLFEMGLLHELFSSATHDASAAMCRWTNGLITLSLDEVREIPLESACAELKIGDDMLTMVVLSLQGEIGGEMILTFDEQNARELAASLLGREAQADAPWSDLEQSALNETGNILGCAYMNALTRLIGADLVPSPPYFIQDYGASVLQQALMAQAMTSNQALICRTSFQREGKELNWNVFFVPTQALREKMDESLRTAI